MLILLRIITYYYIIITSLLRYYQILLHPLLRIITYYYVIITSLLHIITSIITYYYVFLRHYQVKNLKLFDKISLFIVGDRTQVGMIAIPKLCHQAMAVFTNHVILTVYNTCRHLPTRINIQVHISCKAPICT